MSQQPFGDLPLFKELQRLLESGGGPVNSEIALQIARSIAVDGTLEAPSDAERSREHHKAVLDAQQVLAGYTRLTASEPPATKLMTRMEWIETTLEGWTWLIGVFAARLQTMGSSPLGGSAPGMDALLGQIGPLMMGFQCGTLLGHLGREVLYGNELPIPRDGDDMCIAVSPNVLKLADDYGFDRSDLLSWVALRDSATHLVPSAHPWVDRYLRAALTEVVDSIEIDMSDLERRIADIQSSGLDALAAEPGAQMGWEDGAALPVIPTDRHLRAVDRLRSFLAVWEGYPSFVTREVAAQVIPSAGRIEEIMVRHNATSTPGKKALATTLGIAMDRKGAAAGETFVAAVVRLHGIAAVNRLWEAPDNLPTPEEVADPFLWIERLT